MKLTVKEALHEMIEITGKKILFEVCELHIKNKQTKNKNNKKQPIKIHKTKPRMMVELFQMTMEESGD